MNLQGGYVLTWEVTALPSPSDPSPISAGLTPSGSTFPLPDCQMDLSRAEGLCKLSKL